MCNSIKVINFIIKLDIYFSITNRKTPKNITHTPGPAICLHPFDRIHQRVYFGGEYLNISRSKLSRRCDTPLSDVIKQSRPQPSGTPPIAKNPQSQPTSIRHSDAFRRASLPPLGQRAPLRGLPGAAPPVVNRPPPPSQSELI